MNMLRLILIGLLFILALAGGYYLVAGGSGKVNDSPAPDRIWRNDDCQSCHPGVWKEWYGSWHRMAYVDPLYKKRSNNYADATCNDCHIPRNIPEVGFGPRTLPRASDKKDGINCLSCHYDGKRIVTARENPVGDCRPRYDAALGTELACIGCHNQHKLHEEWRKTPFFKQGVDCIDCHMPVVKRSRGDTVIEGRHHGFIASRNRDFSKSAVLVKVVGPREPGGEAGVLQVSIKNEKSGHDFPADSRHKAADLITQFYSANDAKVGNAKTERFHIPMRDALDQKRTTIPYSETRRFSYDIPPEAAYGKVLLLYRQEKDDPNADAQQLFERTVRW